MPAILKQVDAIIKTGAIDNTIEKNLNPNQLTEEASKIIWVENNPDKAESLFELEDHDLLQGQISIVGLDHPEYFPRFQSLFSCKWDAIDRALMSIGNYGQREKKVWRYQFGSGSEKNGKAWRNLFHGSVNRKGFERTKDVLAKLLSRTDSFTNEFLSGIFDRYISDCENNKNFEWRYYYIKYCVFRPGSFGKYSWSDFGNKPYEFSVMLTERDWSKNTFQPFLKAIDEKNLSKDHYGQRIIAGKNYIVCENAAYVVKNTETDAEVDRIAIAQNDKGVDTEDRIKKLQ